VSITGYNDIPLLDMIDPALTTVRMQLHEIGKAAGQVMLAQFEGQPVTPMTQRVGCALLVRSSLGRMSQPRPI
jgi:LacI family transcriptional regulator